MRKCILTIILFSMIIMLTSCQNGQGFNRSCNPANLDGFTICYDGFTGLYAIEENATLVIGVDNDIYGQSIVYLWDASYPEKAGSLQYEVFDVNNFNLTHEAQRNWPDVFLIQDFNAINREFTLNAIHSELAKIIQANTIESYLLAANRDARMIHYAPIMFEGVVFGYNKTMLKTLGVKTDALGIELPSNFDSWEEIFQIAQQWDQQRPSYGNQLVNVIFPLDLLDMFAFYHVISSGGFSLFEEEGSNEPGYDQIAYLHTFDFLQEAKEAKIAVDSEGLLLLSPWMNKEQYSRLPQKQMPFRLFSNHEIFDLHAVDEFDDYVLAKFPTYKGIPQQSLGRTKGFVINSATKYRSAAMELLRLIYSKDGFALLSEATTYAPVLKSTSNFIPNTIKDSLQLQFVELISTTSSEPLIALSNNPSIKAIEASYYSVLGEVMRKFWDEQLTIEEVLQYTMQLVDEKNKELNR